MTAPRGGPEPDETTLERAPESDAERTEDIPRDTGATGPAHGKASRRLAGAPPFSSVPPSSACSPCSTSAIS